MHLSELNYAGDLYFVINIHGKKKVVKWGNPMNRIVKNPVEPNPHSPSPQLALSLAARLGRSCMDPGPG
jgi:hypothetical protein